MVALVVPLEIQVIPVFPEHVEKLVPREHLA